MGLNANAVIKIEDQDTHIHTNKEANSSMWLIKILGAYFVKVLSTDPSAKKFGVKLNPGMSAEAPARGIKPDWFSPSV